MKLLTLIAVFILLANSVYGYSIDEVKKAYLYGDYNGAIKLAFELSEEKLSDELLYYLGLSFSKLGNYPQARKYLRKLLKRYPDSKRYQSALVKLVDCYFLEDNLERAQALYISILDKYPSAKYKPLIYLRLAQIAAKQGSWSAKHKYVDILAEDYPGSLEYVYAKRLKRRGDFFTIQVGAFSDKDNALSLVRKLKPRYSVYMVRETYQGLPLYKVRVGKFNTRKEAVVLAEILQDKGYPTRVYP